MPGLMIGDIMAQQNLDRLFNPQSVAVIGASNRPGSVGHDVMRNLIGSGFQGIIYPVNPKRKSIQGVRAYKSLTAIDDTVDLAIVATPAQTVPSIVKEAGKKGVGGMVVITAGFKEAGEEGKKLFADIQRIAKQWNVRLIGPNCLGFLRPGLSLNASFSSKMALPGNIAFLSQSGALCTAVLDWANANNLGFSYFVSLGSMADICFNDLIEYFEDDDETKGIVIYMESLVDARRFMQAARSYTRKKPIFVLKVGRSSQGANAARSHTGSLAGDDMIFDAAFRKAGIVRVYDSYDILGCAQILGKQNRPTGNRLAVITNAGGPGVIATDSIVEEGGRIATLSSSSIDTLNKALPKHWSHGNPVDVLGDAGPDRYKIAIETCMRDSHVDGVLVILTAQSMTDPEAVANELVSISQKHKTPVMACWMGEDDVARGRCILEKGNVPLFDMPECAVRSFMKLYSSHVVAKSKHPFKGSREAHSRKAVVSRMISRVIKEGRSSMTEFEAKQALSYYGFPLVEHAHATTEEEAAAAANAVGYPVAMKILSPDIIHKTDAEGVRVKLKDEASVRKAFNAIMENARLYDSKAHVDGVFIERMMEYDYELLLGSKSDPTFGPSIMFGLGGTSVELYKDTALTLPPIDMPRAKRLMEKTKVATLMAGYRGHPRANLKSIQELICSLSQFVSDFPQVTEVDINPLAVRKGRLAVLDAKIVLNPELEKGKSFEHLSIDPRTLE